MSDGFTDLRVRPSAKAAVVALADRLKLPQYMLVEAAVAAFDRQTAGEMVETAAERAARLAGVGQ